MTCCIFLPPFSCHFPERTLAGLWIEDGRKIKGRKMRIGR